MELSVDDYIDTRCSINGPEGAKTLKILYYHLTAVMLGTIGGE
jgi:hypothetical protein